MPQLCVVQRGPACPVVRCHGQEMRALAGRPTLGSPSLGEGSCLCPTEVLAVICRVFFIPYSPLNQFCE